MSKFFEKTSENKAKAANEDPLQSAEKMLEQIHNSVHEQVPAVSVPVQDEHQMAGVAKIVDALPITGAVPNLGGAPDTPVNSSGEGRPSTAVLGTFSLPKDSENLISGTIVESAAEAYRVLRTRISRRKAVSNLKTIALSSTIPGEGKTLTAANLAMSTAQLRGTRVLLVDGDLRSAGLSRLLKLPQGAGLAEVLEGKAEFKEAVLETDQSGLFVLGAGLPSVPPPELFASPRWHTIVEITRQGFDYVFIDCPPVSPLSDFELISVQCDAILGVVRARRAKRESLQKAFGNSKKLLGVVFNAVQNVEKHEYYSYYYSRGGSSQRSK